MGSNTWAIHKTIAEEIRDFIFDAGIAGIENIDVVKMCVNIEKDMVEAIGHSVLQASETIDLADQKWKIRRRPAPPGEAITLTNVG